MEPCRRSGARTTANFPGALPSLGRVGLVLFLSAAALAAPPVEVDVCIYGATSGGVIAAVQAARMGKSVALVSTNSHVGGMTSGGLGWTDVGEPGSIGGVALEFYERVGSHYGKTVPQFAFEPHVAETTFREMLTEAGVTPLLKQRLVSVVMEGAQITAIKTSAAQTITARRFIDATYEGDLMALAGVSWTMGRESRATYGESIGGVNAGSNLPQFPLPVDPYVRPGAPRSGRLRWVQSGAGGRLGDGDQHVQAYNFRLCLTNDPANRRPIPAPPGYREQSYLLLTRLMDSLSAAGRPMTLRDFLCFSQLPNSKFDVNSRGAFSTDCIGLSDAYPTATAASRAVIIAAHRNYIQGLLFYLGHSRRVPAHVREEMLSYGFCADEFRDTGGWPHQLYVREARRMIGSYIMRQQNCHGNVVVEDPIALGSYYLDSHDCQRVVRQDAATNEGQFNWQVSQPYGIAYRSILPRGEECENLLVTFALSASHVAFSSLRMEPVLMMVSQSAATAACLSIDRHVAVQYVDYHELADRLTADGQVLFWPPMPANAVIVDNAAKSGTTSAGSWTSSHASAGFYGTDYFHDGNVGKGTSRFRFTPKLPTAGEYDVYLRWVAGPNRATNVPVKVQATGTSSTLTVDQTKNGSTWVHLGRWSFDAGSAGSVLLQTGGTDGFVIADAAYWLPVSRFASFALQPE